MALSCSDKAGVAAVVLSSLVLSTAGALGCRRSRTPKSSDLDRGRAALAAGRPAEAVVALRRAVRMRPGRLGPRRLLARALVAVGKLSKAREVLSKGVSLSAKGTPERYPLLLDLGQVLVRQARYGAAAETYGRAIEEEPDKVTAYWRLGELYEMNRQWKDAEAVYERLLKKFPKGAVAAEVQLRMARCALRGNDVTSAMRHADEGLAIEKAAPRVRANLEKLAGKAAMAAGNWKRAEQHLRRAMSLGLGDRQTLSLYAKAVFEFEGCNDRSLSALKKAARRGALLSSKAISCLAASGRNEDHELALVAAQANDRRGAVDEEGRILLARLLLESGRPGVALEKVEDLAADRGRLDGEAALLRAECLAALGRHGEAFAQFSRLVAQGRSDPAILRGQALEAVWSGRYEVGVRLVEPLVRAHGSDPELLTAWAVALGGLGRRARARRLLLAAADAARATGDTRALERAVVYSAWLDLRTGRLTGALEKIRGLAGRPGPFQLHALDIQAHALMRLGRKKEAAAAVRRALALHPGPVRRKYFQDLLSGLGAQSSPTRRE